MIEHNEHTKKVAPTARSVSSMNEREAWRAFFQHSSSPKKFDRPITVLMPMAGKGQRFVDAGYSVPKPLILADGKPSFIRSLESFPSAAHYVFVCSRDHAEKFSMVERIKEYVPASTVVIDESPKGQAASCMVAESKIDPNAPLLIASCDVILASDMKRFERIMDDENVDCVLWTFRNSPFLKRKPESLAYAATEGDDVKFVVSKKVISDSPQNDHAITAIFYFRKASIFFNATRKMIKKGIKANNEFTIDLLPNELIEEGKKVKVFQVDFFVDLGTPVDFENYIKWKNYFKDTR